MGETRHSLVDTIAVTGCNGSVGVRVTLLALKHGNIVRGIDLEPPRATSAETRYITSHPNFSFVKADVSNYTQVCSVLDGCDAVIHLAAIANPMNRCQGGVHDTNVVNSWNVLRACADLGIDRLALASSVNAVGGVFNKTQQFDYFPIDEHHPCRPDEAYGLSKQILEIQADAMALRYPTMRIASLRLSWSVPTKEKCKHEYRARDLWGYVQEDAAAEAFLLAIAPLNIRWSGHERFYIVAPTPVVQDGDEPDFDKLRKRDFPDVPVREGRSWRGFFDCSKAERLLGWVHKDVD